MARFKAPRGMIEMEVTGKERRNQDGLTENKCCTSILG